MRRTALTAALAALALALAAPPALAAEMEWGSKTPKDGSTVQGTGLKIVVHVDLYGGDVHDWAVSVVAPQGASYPGYGVLCTGPGNDHGTADIDCPWDSTGYPPPTAARSYNGQYDIVVEAWEDDCGLLGPCDQGARHVLKRTVFVVNPAQAPGNVHASFDAASRQPTVTWDRNPEPDLVKYVIEERLGDGNWRSAGERGPGETSFQRAALTDAGTYRFRVAAVRADGRDSRVQSGWTESADQVVFNPPAPEAPDGPVGAPADGEPVPESFDGSPTTTATAQPGPVRAQTPRSGGGASFSSPRSSNPSSGGLSAPSTLPGLPGSPFMARGEEPDPGFSQYLPYRQKGAEDTGDEEVAAPAPRPAPVVPKRRDPVGLVAPLAAGLAIFVLAMQLTYVVRRRPAIADVDDFSEWLGL